MHLVRSGTHFYLGTGWVPVARELSLEPGEQVGDFGRGCHQLVPLLMQLPCDHDLRLRLCAWSLHFTSCLTDAGFCEALPQVCPWHNL